MVYTTDPMWLKISCSSMLHYLFTPLRVTDDELVPMRNTRMQCILLINPYQLDKMVFQCDIIRNCFG